MKICTISLGCDKNLVDSEVMLGKLAHSHHTFTDDEHQADIILINTCCFINDAKEESIQTILEMAELKKAGKIKGLIVSGCLAQRYKEEIQKEIPEVDAILGTTAIDEIVGIVDEIAKGKTRNCFKDISAPVVTDKDRMVTTGGHYAYLKIAEGCDKCCTYCIIPKIRGHYRSVPMDDLLEQAKKLADEGVKELLLVAQETTLYGVDLYGEKKLPELLRKLCAIDGFRWIRVLYCYPEEITDELIQTMKEEDKICNYLDIPIQSASDPILKKMGRRTSQEQLRSTIIKLRKTIPDICLRTTLISGFPGETQEDFEETYRFVNEMEFDRLGVFAYSEEEDTPAAMMSDQVEESVRNNRRDELMELQQAIAFEAAENCIGKEMAAMIEGRLVEENVYTARTYKDAPGVDGMLFIHSDRELMTGDFVHVRITGSNEYDLIGEIIE